MIGEKIRTMRIQKHLSQKALAENLFISQQTVCKWETGKTTPTPEMIAKLADYFGVSTDYLLKVDDSSINTGISQIIGNHSNGNVQNASTCMTSIEQEILKIVRTLPMRSQNKLLSYAYELSDDAKKTAPEEADK